MFSYEIKHPQDCEGLGSDEFWPGSSPVWTCSGTSVVWDPGHSIERDGPVRSRISDISDPHGLNANRISSNLCGSQSAPTCFQSVPWSSTCLAEKDICNVLQLTGEGLLPADWGGVGGSALPDV